jgi:Dynamin family
MTLAKHFDSYSSWRDSVGRQIDRLQEWLAERDLLDSQTEQRLRRIRGRLAEDRLVVAFVAEFSRGKSELINALFFADRGGRVLPSSAGRTTMCPTEIAWDKDQAPKIALLPIETRAEGTSIAELRSVPEAWLNIALKDVQSADAMADTLRRVGDTKRVSADVAQGLGFSVGDGTDGSLTADADGQVDIPRWRHALINFQHPLLEQGLVVLDTPGLNAIGAEPELTLSLLPSAHAVLFILAADTGVTQTDLTVWRDHVGSGPGRLVVLNKIDGLWDGLRADEDIDAEISRQIESCGRILELPTSSVFAVSAQKGLVAKVSGDIQLLEKSRLPRLEDALAEGLLPTKRDIVARGTAAEGRHVAAEVGKLLETRRAALLAQLSEFKDLRGKNENVVGYMVDKAKAEKEIFERGLRDYYAVRSVFSQLSDALFANLGLESMRSHAREARETMRNARFTPQLVGAMSKLFAAAHQHLAASDDKISEIAQMMTAMRLRFGQAYGVELGPPPAFSLADRRQQMTSLEKTFRQQFGAVLTLVTRDKRTLIQQFFEIIASQMRKTFDHANRDADQWLRALMAPLEGQVREVQRQLKHRLDNVRRIQNATDSLEDRIDELEQAHATLHGQIGELKEIETGLAATLRAPPNQAQRIAA